MRISSADWFKAGVARQRVGPISLGIAPRACMILSKLLLLLLLLLLFWVDFGSKGRLHATAFRPSARVANPTPRQNEPQGEGPDP